MPENITVNFNPVLYRDQLMLAVDGHVADLKNTLRSLEDGSFLNRAATLAPGGTVTLGIAIHSGLERDGISRACANCFKAMTSDLITFFDRMIAFDKVLKRGAIQIDRPLDHQSQVIDFAREKLEQAYFSVARDTSITNPKKVARCLLNADSIKSAESIIAIRRCLEHHGSVPNVELQLWFRRMAISTGGQEIKRFPHDVVDGNLTLSLQLESKVFPAGMRIAFTENDVENVSLTIKLLATEAVQVGE